MNAPTKIAAATDTAWAAAEQAYANSSAELDALAEPYTDEELDGLADARLEAIDNILALPARTPAQAFRKLELAMFDAHSVLSHVDYPALLSEARQVVVALALPSEVSPGFVTALEAYRQADSDHCDYLTEIEEPAVAANREAREAVPHYRTINSFTNVNSDPTTLSTENVGTIATVRRVLADVEKGFIFSRPVDDSDAAYLATLRELAEADDRRTAEIKRIADDPQLAEVKAKGDELRKASVAAFFAVLSFPASSIHDLRAKAEFIEAECAWEDGSDSVLADVRRLAGAA